MNQFIYRLLKPTWRKIQMMVVTCLVATTGFSQNPCDLDLELEYVVFSGANCAMEFSLAEEFPFVDDPMCQEWVVTGTEDYVVSNGTLLILDGTQPFSVCYTACCEVGGEIQTFEECLDFPNGCEEGCGIDLTILEKQDDTYPCQYYFLINDSQSDTDEAICQSWYIENEEGEVIASYDGSSVYHEFTEAGSYSVCYVACCTINGVVTQEETCIDIELESCDCVSNPVFGWGTLPEDPCHYGFYANQSTVTTLPTCQQWTITGPEVDETFNGQLIEYQFETNGTYTVCHTSCCVQGEETLTTEYCEDIVVNSCGSCEFDNHIKMVQDEIHSCTWTFAEISPQGESTEGICHSWQVTNSEGEIVGTWDDENYFTFEFPEAGNYSVCYIACCTINGVQTLDETCVDVEIESCDCIPQPEFIYQQVVDEPCRYGFLAPNSWESSTPDCQTWTVTGPGVDEVFQGQVLDYTFPANGTYTVCHTACCIQGEETFTAEYCETIVIDECSSCELDNHIKMVQDETHPCSWTFVEVSPQTESTEGICHSWEVTNAAGDVVATWDDSNIFTYEFPEAGTYSVCYIACCTINGVQTIDEACVEVEIESCDCIPQPEFVYQQVQGEPCHYGFLAPNSLDASIPGCQTWSITGPNGNEMIQGQILDYTFPSNGTYTVCHRACCTTDGEVAGEIYCETIEITDCEDTCTPDASFNVSQIQGGQCCFEFESTGGNPWVNSQMCQTWRISQNNTVIFQDQGTSTQFCFTQQGQYTVHYRACCEVDGVITHDTQNQTVNCGTRPDGKGRPRSLEISVMEDMVVYPNPSNGSLNVSFNAVVDQATMKLIDGAGRTLKNWTFSNGGSVFELDASEISAGSYQLFVESKGMNEVIQIVLVD